MPNMVGKLYSFAFSMAGLTGLNTGSFTNLIFTRNGVRVSDAVSSGFTIEEVPITSGEVIGFYKANFTPDAPGFYIVAFTTVMPDNPLVVASVEISGTDDDPTLTYVSLTQDTPEYGALVLTLEKASEYLLMVFNSSDWDVGQTGTINAVAMTGLDPNGNWLTTPLNVVPGTYHIVVRNEFGHTLVLSSYLTV